MNKKILFLDMDNVIVDFMSDVLIRIASCFGQGMSKWNAAASAGIFENQEKDFNKNWKSLVEERKCMRGGR